jgi:hypothetical protein
MEEHLYFNLCIRGGVFGTPCQVVYALAMLPQTNLVNGNEIAVLPCALHPI